MQSIDYLYIFECVGRKKRRKKTLKKTLEKDRAKEYNTRRLGKTSIRKVNKFLVTMTARKHLYPYRTQKLSLPVLKILTGYPVGKIRRCQIFIYSPIAQLVERSAVNR